MDFFRAASSIIRRLESHNDLTGTKSHIRSNLPASILERSNMSLIRDNKCRPLSSAVRTRRSCASFKGPYNCSFSDSEIFRIAFSGVLSS